MRVARDEVLVADGHWNATNILLEELDSTRELNAGSPSPLSMMQGRSGRGWASFLAITAAGFAIAVLDHTWSSTCVANVWLNDRLAGEYSLNGALAGHYGIPVLMATGDQAACGQMLEQLGALEIRGCETRDGGYAAECLPAPSHNK